MSKTRPTFITNTSELDETILAYCLRSKSALTQCLDSVDVNFFDKKYRSFYRNILNYYQRYKELISADVILQQLRKKGVPEERYRWYEQLLDTLYEMELDLDRFEYYLDEFEEGYLDGLLREAVLGSTENPGLVDLLTKQKKPREAWTRVKRVGMFIESREQADYVERGLLRDSVDERIERLERIKSGEENPYGILTGFGPLDNATKGLRPGEMLIIAGRPGTGKSACLVVIAKNLYKGIPGVQRPLNVLLFSIEMPKVQYEQRFDAAYNEILLDHVELGKFTQEEEQKYLEGLKLQKAAANEFYIVDRPNCTPMTIEAEFELALEEFEPDVVLVDYLGIMDPDEDQGQDHLNQGSVAVGLRRIARTRKIPLISAVQMGRPDGRRNNVGTHRLSRSDQIGQTADVVIQIDDSGEDRKPTPTEQENANDIEETPHRFMRFFIIKNRKGAAPDFQMYCKFNKMMIENATEFKSKVEYEHVPVMRDDGIGFLSWVPV